MTQLAVRICQISMESGSSMFQETTPQSAERASGENNESSGS